MMHKKPNQQKKDKQYEELLLEVRRVTRVTRGGRRLAFRAVVIIGDKKGKIGIGISKSQDVTGALKKAIHEAYKNIFIVPIVNADTVPYPITYKYKSAIVKLIPALAGTGLKAGSSVRSVLDLAGYNNILSKIIGTNNKLNNAIATIQALKGYKKTKQTQDKIGVDKEQKDTILKGQDTTKESNKSSKPGKVEKIVDSKVADSQKTDIVKDKKENTKVEKTTDKAKQTDKKPVTKKVEKKPTKKPAVKAKSPEKKPTTKKAPTKKDK